MLQQVRLVPGGGDEEFAWHDPSALMQKLVKGMLSVRARLAPHDRAGMSRQTSAVQSSRFAVRFHFQLLQICRQPQQALVVGKNGPGGVSAYLIVPNSNEREKDGQVPVERR